MRAEIEKKVFEILERMIERLINTVGLPWKSMPSAIFTILTTGKCKDS
jgi:hypothetical protein